MVGRTGAQQPATQAPVVAPPLPQPYFHSTEDTWKTGVKPEDIKAGVIPDYTKLRDKLVVIPVQGNIYLIGGAGANIAVQVSDEGILLVDAGAEAASDRVMNELKQWEPRRLRWIINTNVDTDHTGGNEKVAKFGQAIAAAAGGQAAGFNGAGAGIIAFENVLNRMSAPTGQTASRNTDAWPTDTFFTPRKNIYYGGEPIELHYVPGAHTDGDTMVFFRKSDVIVAGDGMPGDRFAMIDAERGGTIQGALDAMNKVVGMAVAQYNMQGGTRIITGHGRVYNATDAVEFRDTNTIVRDRVVSMVKKGATLDQVKAAKVTLEYDAQYGRYPNWTGDMFVEAIYKEAAKANAPAPATGKKPAAPAKKS
jgi:glyoxylase-like metal-dependent hydrolase (beta-lactamase superfamily II)